MQFRKPGHVGTMKPGWIRVVATFELFGFVLQMLTDKGYLGGLMRVPRQDLLNAADGVKSRAAAATTATFASPDTVRVVKFMSASASVEWQCRLFAAQRSGLTAERNVLAAVGNQPSQAMHPGTSISPLPNGLSLR